MTNLDLGDVAAVYAPFVERIARRLARTLPASVDVQDLVQCGMLGLLDAARRYRSHVGPSFCQYARLRIVGAMVDGLRRGDDATRRLRADIRRAERATRALEQELQRRPTTRELADRLAMSVGALHLVLAKAASLQTVKYANANELEVLESRSAHVGPDTLAVLMADAELRAVEDAILVLSARSGEVLRLYHVEHMTMREIGIRLGVSESRVSQILAKAAAQIRAQVNRTAG